MNEFIQLKRRSSLLLCLPTRQAFKQQRKNLIGLAIGMIHQSLMIWILQLPHRLVALRLWLSSWKICYFSGEEARAPFELLRTNVGEILSDFSLRPWVGWPCIVPGSEWTIVILINDCILVFLLKTFFSSCVGWAASSDWPSKSGRFRKSSTSLLTRYQFFSFYLQLASWLKYVTHGSWAGVRRWSL